MPARVRMPDLVVHWSVVEPTDRASLAGQRHVWRFASMKVVVLVEQI